MKIIVYYLSLLVFIAVVAGYLLSQSTTSPMGMKEMLGVSAALGIYVVAMSLVGEGRSEDERETQHRYISNRAALICGTIVFSLGIIYQLFVLHRLDPWLLIGLIAMNLTKIISLIYLSYKK